MAFRLADVKKTVRSRGDGERYLHPKLLDPAVVSAQVTLALAYFQSRLGRARHETDPEMLVRFFGDPKVARGLVACLGASYRWRTQHFAEALEPEDVTRLAALGLRTPSDLRLYLYDYVNDNGHGFLSAEPMREDNLRPIARRLRLPGAKLDQLAALDAEENAVLVRVGPVPEPACVVAMYNFHTVDAVLRNGVAVELGKVDSCARARLEDACALQGVAFECEGEHAVLRNKPDLFGSYARGGAHLTRALYAAAADAPSLMASGRAIVQVGGKTSIYPFDKETPRALTGRTGHIRHAVSRPEFREEWTRYRAGAGVGNGTAGWRLVSAPESLLSDAGLILAPYAFVRDETRVLLWPATSPGPLDDLRAVHAAGLDVLAVTAAGAGDALPADLPSARAVDGVAGIIEALDRRWNEGRVSVDAQALESLLAEAEARGFVAEETAAGALRCASAAELATRLRPLDPARGVYVPGVGVCSPAFAEGMRKGLRRRAQRTPAA